MLLFPCTSEPFNKQFFHIAHIHTHTEEKSKDYIMRYTNHLKKINIMWIVRAFLPQTKAQVSDKNEDMSIRICGSP